MIFKLNWKSSLKNNCSKMQDRLKNFLTEQGYTHLRRLPDGRLCGLMSFIFTSGLMVGLSYDGYLLRYCFEHEEDALQALESWDGHDDPSGPWIKAKGAGKDRLGPGATASL
jgi:hypothetical protein